MTSRNLRLINAAAKILVFVSLLLGINMPMVFAEQSSSDSLEASTVTLFLADHSGNCENHDHLQGSPASFSSIRLAHVSSSQSRQLGLFVDSNKGAKDDFLVESQADIFELNIDDHSLDSTEAPVLASRLDKVKEAEKILFKKWRGKKTAPEFFENDLKELANYIAARPEAMTLLRSVAKQPFRIYYAPNRFETKVKGDRFFVHSAKVYFDSRSAAVLIDDTHCHEGLSSCSASPADAFIHELLHVKSALLEPEKFIQIGGLSTFGYPIKHEMEVIKQEREIYAKLTDTDNFPRPSRNNHSGRLYETSCVTCIDS